MTASIRRGTFLRLSHGFLDDPDHLALSRDALLLHWCALLYASKHLTDGVLYKNPRARAQWAPHFVADGVDIDPIADELIAAGKWEDWPDHWEIVGFLRWNNSKAQVEAWRAAERDRKQKKADEKREERKPVSDVQITDTPRGTDAVSRPSSARKNGNPFTHLRSVTDDQDGAA